MVRLGVRVAGAAMTVVAMTWTTAGGATAGSGGRDFGDHVSTCVQEHGFDGGMNPGMHTGYVDWDPDHAC
jgi:hypothetical protein